MGNFVTLEAYKPKYSLEPHLSKPLEKFIIIIKCCIVSNSDEFLSQLRPYKARALLWQPIISSSRFLDGYGGSACKEWKCFNFGSLYNGTEVSNFEELLKATERLPQRQNRCSLHSIKWLHFDFWNLFMKILNITIFVSCSIFWIFLQ